MADLSITDSQPLPAAGALSIAKSEPLPDPGFLPTLWKDAKGAVTGIPALANAFLHHPIDTASAIVGRMDFEHPENSTGMLGSLDKTYSEWAQGHHGEALAHEAEALAPGLVKGAGMLGRSEAAATAATAARGAVTGGLKAAGDVRGIAGAGAAGYVAQHLGLPYEAGVAAVSAPRLIAGAVRGAKAALAERLTQAMGSFQDTEMLEGLSQSQLGKKFANATAEEQASIRDIAARLQNPAPAAPPPQPMARPAAPSVPAPEIPGKTIADIAREELTPPAAAPVELTPKARSLAQVEAAMAQKSPGAVEAPQSGYTATGEAKSPQLRAQEITNANRLAKAQRFAAELHAREIEPADIFKIPMGAIAQSQVAKGATPGWGNIAPLLGEKAPSADTINAIYTEMQRLKKAGSAVSAKPGAAEIAAQLKAAMEQSGTIPPGQ